MVSSDTAESCGEISKHSRKEFSPPAQQQQQQQQQTNSISTSKKEEKATTTTIVMHECTNCATKTSPVWRKGPMGPKTLCNACGLKWSQGKMQLDDRGKHNKPSSPPTTTTTTLLSHHQPPTSQSQPTTCSPTEEKELLSTKTTTKTTRMTSMDLTTNNGGSNNFLTPPGTQPQQQISASPANNHNHITVTQLLRHHQLQNLQLQQTQQPTANNNNISTTATLSSLFSAFSPTYPLTMPSIPQTRQHQHQLSPPPTSPIAQAHLFNQHQMSNTTTCMNNNNNNTNNTNNTTFVAFSLQQQQQQPTTSSPNIALTPTKSTPTPPTSSQKRKLSSTTTKQQQQQQQQFSTHQDNNNESSSTPTPTTPNTHHTNNLPTTPTPLRIKKNSKTGRKICSNCGAIKTPVWRKGPLGTGTLCNACGLKYSLGTITLDPLTGAIPGKQSFLEIVSEDDDDDEYGHGGHDENDHMERDGTFEGGGGGGGGEREMMKNEVKNDENSSQNHHHHYYGSGKSGKLLELKSSGRKLSSSSSGANVRVKKTKNSSATLTTTKKMKKVMKKQQREKLKSKSVRVRKGSSSTEKQSSRFNVVENDDDQFYDFDDFEGEEDDEMTNDDDDEMMNDSEMMNDEFDGDDNDGTMEDFEFSTSRNSLQKPVYNNVPISRQQQQKALLKMKNRRKLAGERSVGVIPVRDSSVTPQQKSSRFLLSENCHFYTRLLPQVIEPLNCHNDCCDLLSVSNNSIVQKHDEMFLSVFVDRSRRTDKKRKMFNSRESSEAEEEEKRDNDGENVRNQKKQKRMHDLSTFYGYSGTLVPCNLMTLPRMITKNVSSLRNHEQVERNMTVMIHSRLERNTMTFIMMFLDLKSLYSCMTVCKQWSRIILNDNDELSERKTVSLLQNVSKNGSDGGSDDDGKRNINSLLSSSLWMKVYDARWTIRNDDVLKSLFMRRDCRVQWRRLVQARLSVEQNENQNENKSIVLDMNNANGEYEQFLKQYCVFDPIQAKEAAQVAAVAENKEKSGVAATDVALLLPDQQQTTDQQPPQLLPQEQPLSVQ